MLYALSFSNITLCLLIKDHVVFLQVSFKKSKETLKATFCKMAFLWVTQHSHETE